MRWAIYQWPQIQACSVERSGRRSHVLLLTLAISGIISAAIGFPQPTRISAQTVIFDCTSMAQSIAYDDQQIAHYADDRVDQQRFIEHRAALVSAYNARCTSGSARSGGNVAPSAGAVSNFAQGMNILNGLAMLAQAKADAAKLANDQARARQAEQEAAQMRDQAADYQRRRAAENPFEPSSSSALSAANPFESSAGNNSANPFQQAPAARTEQTEAPQQTEPNFRIFDRIQAVPPGCRDDIESFRVRIYEDSKSSLVKLAQIYTRSGGQEKDQDTESFGSPGLPESSSIVSGRVDNFINKMCASSKSRSLMDVIRERLYNIPPDQFPPAPNARPVQPGKGHPAGSGVRG